MVRQVKRADSIPSRLQGRAEYPGTDLLPMKEAARGGYPPPIRSEGTLAGVAKSTAIAAGFYLALVPPLAAKDFGVQGPVWEVAEPSLIDAIQARLKEMEAAGDLAKMQEEMQDRTRAYVNRPRPVAGMSKALVARNFEVDLSITVSRDLADHNGVIFARAGTVINPLDYSMFDKRIVLFDGDDPEQVAFALAEGTELDTLLVLTNGAPLDLMRSHQRRFYFDQDGQIANRFSITHLPSVITRGDRVMLVNEVPLGGSE